MKALEWIGLGLAALLLLKGLSSGGAAGSLTSGWGSGMTFGSSLFNGLPAFSNFSESTSAAGTTVSQSSGVPWWAGLDVNYSQNNGITAGYGF